MLRRHRAVRRDCLEVLRPERQGGKHEGEAARPKEPAAPGEAAEQPGKAAPKKKRAPPRVFMDAGVQGPVHYNGTRYIHGNQGFRRADEVTFERASSGWRMPPGWGAAAAAAERPHRD